MSINFTQIVKRYKGLWVALKDDNKSVITDGKTVKEVLRKARQKGFDHPLLFKVPVKILPYIGV